MTPLLILGDVVLKILPPVVQNGLNIPREGAFLAQGRINAPPHRQHATEIGVGIVLSHHFQFSIFTIPTPKSRSITMAFPKLPA